MTIRRRTIGRWSTLGAGLSRLKERTNKRTGEWKVRSHLPVTPSRSSSILARTVRTWDWAIRIPMAATIATIGRTATPCAAARPRRPDRPSASRRGWTASIHRTSDRRHAARRRSCSNLEQNAAVDPAISASSRRTRWGNSSRSRLFEQRHRGARRQGRGRRERPTDKSPRT